MPLSIPASCCPDLQFILLGWAWSLGFRQLASGPVSGLDLRLLIGISVFQTWLITLPCLGLLVWTCFFHPPGLVGLHVLARVCMDLVPLSCPLIGQPHSFSFLMCRPLCKDHLIFAVPKIVQCFGVISWNYYSLLFSIEGKA